MTDPKNVTPRKLPQESWISMNLDLAKVLTTVGPAASIIFAAWIFVAFLQTRYDAAIDRYRDLIEKFRSPDLSDSRKANMRDEILNYKRRCELMNRAIGCGLISAMLLISTMIFGGFSLVFQDSEALKLVSMGTATLGLILVIVGAAMVIMEGRIIRRQIHTELLDIPELAHGIDQGAGDINDPHRRGQDRVPTRS
ncbi:DUF2721 domain-containing protein [Methylobacterium sp. Leaf125]|uniref:DUF2721 domain-containing protein n=2 Tax=unclassified Methylobacterium TaxID=2615210 RepID=UPI0009E6AFED|nr:DUF2721 domain-containing protein [Methylobacterium sp. Leaf125]